MPTTLYDEASPLGRVPGDSEAGRVSGMADAVHSAPMAEIEPAVLPLRYIPDRHRVAAGFALASAAAQQGIFGPNRTPAKFADEYSLWRGGAITFAPVPGMEAQIGTVTKQYNPYQTKLPQQTAAPPSSSAIANSFAQSPADPLASDVNSMLALLGGM